MTQREDAQDPARQPDATIINGQAGPVLRLSGPWTVHSIAPMPDLLRNMKKRQGNGQNAITAIDLAGISEMDTSGALLINLLADKNALDPLRAARTANPCFSRDNADSTCLPLLNAREAHRIILERCHPAEVEKLPPPPGQITALLLQTGERVVKSFDLVFNLIGFWGQFLCTLAGILLRPSRMRLTALVSHMEQTGLRAVPIVALLAFLIGVVISYMSSDLMAQYGTQVFLVDLLSILTFREMAVIITAILVAGRSGSAFTAQLGSMVANEEVDAMISMGVNPMETLVMPRILALMLMLPALLLVADITAMIGGMTAAAISVDLSINTFINRFMSIETFKHFMVGMVKAPCFAVIIGLVGCFLGFQATGSAESVGRLTTQSVVTSIFLVIVLDAAFAIFFMSIGV